MLETICDTMNHAYQRGWITSRDVMSVLDIMTEIIFTLHPVVYVNRHCSLINLKRLKY